MKRRIARAIALTVAVLAVVVVTAWGALALYYLAPASEGVRRPLAWIVAALGLALVTALLAGRWRVPAARDAIRVRTNYRRSPPEDLYVFRVTAPIDNGRRMFLRYMRDINWIAARPRFYNTLTTNCTTMILTHAAVNPGAVPYSWKILLSGYAPEYAYEQGRLDRSMPFSELMRRSHINAAAQAADQAPDFSRRIRAALP